jgi:hypothetical protein
MEIIYNMKHVTHPDVSVKETKKTSHIEIYKSMIVIQYLIILLCGVGIHYYFNDGQYYYLIIVIMPLLMVTYSTWSHINSNKTDTELLKQLNDEIESEQTPHIIPILLFSLSIILQYIHPKKFRMMVYYMLFAVIFGTICPQILKQMIFDYTSLHRLIVFSELEYTFVSIAIGFLFLSISIMFSSR